MKLEVNGKLYSGFTAATADVRLDRLANSFSFSSGPDKYFKVPFTLGDECIVYADDEQILSGYIELISGDGDDTSHTLDIIGRDRTADVVDSTIGTIKDIQAPITLKKIVELIIDHIGADIDVIDYTGFSFSTGELVVAPESGDNAFSFLEKISRRKQAILTSNSDGNIVIQQSIGLNTSSSIIHQVDGKNNNVMRYSFRYDDTGRFNSYKAIGNININTLGAFGNLVSKKVVSQAGLVLDDRIREGRQYIVANENAGSSTHLKKRAEWEANIRKARSRTYSALVSDYRNQDGDLWSPNMLVKVVDEHANINDIMLINSVIYRYDDNGKTTEINLVNKNAYSLLVAEPIEDAKIKTESTPKFDFGKYTID